MIVLDASVLIAHLDADDISHERAKGLLLDAAGRPLRVSAVTMAEVLVQPSRLGVLDAARRAADLLLVETVGISAEAPGRLAALRVQTGLKLPDCCVLLAAEDVGATAVLSLDVRLTRAAAAAGYAVAPPP